MKRLLLFSMICLVCAGCGAENDTGNEPVNSNVDFDESDYEDITRASNHLGFNMLEQVEPDASGNTFMSPISLFMAISMAYNGADGTTKDEIESVLDLDDLNLNDVNKANASLLAMLDKETDHIKMGIANSIWVSDDFNLQDTYQKNNQEYLNADVNSMDISDETSADEINDWVEDATNDKITEMVDSPLNQDMVALLLNAIYFNGDWTYPFDPDETTEQTFHPSDDKTTDVEMMELNEDELEYMENDTFQAVSLPYGDEEMSMTIFLPKEDELDTFKKEMTTENWDAWQNEFRKQKGTVNLPKFELEYETILNETMQNLGIKKAFSGDAEFPNMIQENEPIRISKVKQKTYINVDETGTEAAGSTSVEMETTSLPIDDPFSMIVDKPFLIAITDDETDVILFLGIVNNPETA